MSMEIDDMLTAEPWLKIGDAKFRSRLIVGIEQYDSVPVVRDILTVTGADVFITTVDPDSRRSSLLLADLDEVLPLDRFIWIGTTSFSRSKESALRTAHILRLWTLTEAYSKALGQGLRLGFNEFGFSPGGRLRAPDGSAASRGEWDFATHPVMDRYLLSVACHDAGLNTADDTSVHTMLDRGFLSAMQPKAPEEREPGAMPGPRDDEYVPYEKSVTGSFLVAASAGLRVGLAFGVRDEPNELTAPLEHTLAAFRWGARLLYESKGQEWLLAFTRSLGSDVLCPGALWAATHLEAHRLTLAEIVESGAGARGRMKEILLVAACRDGRERAHRRPHSVVAHEEVAVEGRHLEVDVFADRAADRDFRGRDADGNSVDGCSGHRRTHNGDRPLDAGNRHAGESLKGARENLEVPNFG